MPQKKQTARKTTGKHERLTSILSERAPAKRVRYDPLANTIHTGDPYPLRSKRNAAGTSATPRASPLKPARSSSSAGPSSDLFSLMFPPEPSQTNGLASSTVTRRHPQLHTPISVCIQFASWLETQKCAHEHLLVQAVERDGGQLLSLAQATITFDNALRGNVLPPVNGVKGALGEHARTLRVFAQLLQSKISEGTLSEELEKAVLRDGEALLRLALCCLDFDRAVQGSSAAS